LLLLLQQRRGAAGFGLGAMIKYLQGTRSGAAGNERGATAKYLRRTMSCAAGFCLGTMIK
jgi:hypothetical protein